MTPTIRGPSRDTGEHCYRTQLKAPTSETVRRVALVLRVSAGRQAMNPEGSLKNQVQRQRQHIAYKSDACGEIGRRSPSSPSAR